MSCFFVPSVGTGAVRAEWKLLPPWLRAWCLSAVLTGQVHRSTGSAEMGKLIEKEIPKSTLCSTEPGNNHINPSWPSHPTTIHPQYCWDTHSCSRSGKRNEKHKRILKDQHLAGKLLIQSIIIHNMIWARSAFSHTALWAIHRVSGEEGREEAEFKTKIISKHHNWSFPSSWIYATLCCASEGQHSLSYCIWNPSVAGTQLLPPVLFSPFLACWWYSKIIHDNLRVRMGQFNNQVRFNFLREVLNLLSHVHAYSLRQRLENQNKCNKYNDL